MKFYLESYGCTLNHGEARNLTNILTLAGHINTKEPEDADILVIFTCTVIRTTELKMLRQIGKFNGLKKPIIVSGCMAIVQQKEVLNIKPDTYFLPPSDLNKIHLLIDKISEELDIPLFQEKKFEEEKIAGKNIGLQDTIDSIVPISTGCRGHCTYCITRLARGKLLSYPEEQILKAITESVTAGSYEIRLTAQDTACYGFGTSKNLATLLAKINKLNTNHQFKVRIGMMNPDSLKPIIHNLIEVYKSPRIFKFLHIPVQSGDNDLLAGMGRRYTVEDFLFMVGEFRGQFQNLTISTDIIIGYPTETSHQFNKSLELIQRLQPNIVNITRFSARPKTSASKLPNRISGSKVKSRSRKLTELRFSISKKINEQELGNKYRVLITERVKKGTVLSRNDNYTPIVIKKELPLGKWLELEICDATDSYLIGIET